MSSEERKPVNVTQLLKTLEPYLHDLEQDNIHEPSAGLFYDSVFGDAYKQVKAIVDGDYDIGQEIFTTANNAFYAGKSNQYETYTDYINGNKSNKVLESNERMKELLQKALPMLNHYRMHLGEDEDRADTKAADLITAIEQEIKP